MEIVKLKDSILSLTKENREYLLKELSLSLEETALFNQISRGHILDNKMGSCPHCSHDKYVRFGIDKGSQRYKCKSCNRSFTEYTGTWLAGLKRKDVVSSYLKLMIEEKSFR